MKITCCKGHKEVAMTVFTGCTGRVQHAGAAHLPCLGAVFVRRHKTNLPTVACRLLYPIQWVHGL